MKIRQRRAHGLGRKNRRILCERRAGSRAVKAFPLPESGATVGRCSRWSIQQPRQANFAFSPRERGAYELCLNPLQRWGFLSGLAATIKLYVFLHDESGMRRPVPDLPPTSGLMLSAGNLTHVLRAIKNRTGADPVRSLVRPLLFGQGRFQGGARNADTAIRIVGV